MFEDGKYGHFETKPHAGDDILEELRHNIAKSMGVTLQGNRLTMRWSRKNKGELDLVHVHCIIVSVGAPELDDVLNVAGSSPA